MFEKVALVWSAVVLVFAVLLQQNLDSDSFTFQDKTLEMVHVENNIISTDAAILHQPGGFLDVDESSIIIYEGNLYRVGYKSATTIILHNAMQLTPEDTYDVVIEIYPKLHAFQMLLQQHQEWFYLFYLVMVGLIVLLLYVMYRDLHPNLEKNEIENAKAFERALRQVKKKYPMLTIDSINSLHHQRINHTTFEQLVIALLQCIVQERKQATIQVVANDEVNLVIEISALDVGVFELDLVRLQQLLQPYRYHMKEKLEYGNFNIIIEIISTK
ncbi:MAG: hypothetical protein ACRCZJ_01000 [Erysipelotrichaceae bacterium]